MQPSPLADLPASHGLGGAVGAGIGAGVWVGGGSHFAEAPPWEGGTKTWHDRSYLLDQPDGPWREGPRLPRAMGYGAAVRDDFGSLWIIGGADAKQHFREVWRLGQGARGWERMANLPAPCAMGVALVWQNGIHCLTGSPSPNSVSAMRQHWRLDLDQPQLGWSSLAEFPGSGRILAAAGCSSRELVIGGGAQLVAGQHGKPQRVLCQDVYGFDGRTWRRLADLPEPAVASPGPMPWVHGKLWLLGGDTGRGMQSSPLKHPGFSRILWSYHPVLNHWSREGRLPAGLVTAPLVSAFGGWVLPGGEIRPGLRSPKVWLLTFKANERTP